MKMRQERSDVNYSKTRRQSGRNVKQVDFFSSLEIDVVFFFLSFHLLYIITISRFYRDAFVCWLLIYVLFIYCHYYYTYERSIYQRSRFANCLFQSPTTYCILGKVLIAIQMIGTMKMKLKCGKEGGKWFSSRQRDTGNNVRTRRKGETGKRTTCVQLIIRIAILKCNYLSALSVDTYAECVTWAGNPKKERHKQTNKDWTRSEIYTLKSLFKQKKIMKLKMYCRGRKNHIFLIFS